MKTGKNRLDFDKNRQEPVKFITIFAWNRCELSWELSISKLYLFKLGIIARALTKYSAAKQDEAIIML